MFFEEKTEIIRKKMQLKSNIRSFRVVHIIVFLKTNSTEKILADSYPNTTFCK